jgi:hypothetical protein
MRREIIGILAAIVLAIVAFVWIETFSSSFRSCIEKDHRAAISYLRCTVRFSEEHDKAITALSAILLAIVTGGLVFVGYLQIRTNRAQLRGYVGVASARVIVETNKIPESVVVLKNDGATPARGVMNVSGFAVGPYPQPQKIQFDFKARAQEFRRGTKVDLGAGGTSTSITSIS